jgi:SAM-dependent methyltransferase
VCTRDLETIGGSMMSAIAINEFIKLPFNTVLDIGCGRGAHTHFFEYRKKTVLAIDIKTDYPGAIQDDYNEYHFGVQFDAIWISHVLEHQRNVGLFLDKVNSDLKEDGFLCITVPPMKTSIVGGHLTVWNAGLLVYNLVLAGVDCSKIRMKQYDYNISIILQKRGFIMPDLSFDRGDIELLAKYFPEGMKKQSFNGNVTNLNWE